MLLGEKGSSTNTDSLFTAMFLPRRSEPNRYIPHRVLPNKYTGILVKNIKRVGYAKPLPGLQNGCSFLDHVGQP